MLQAIPCETWKKVYFSSKKNRKKNYMNLLRAKLNTQYRVKSIQQMCDQIKRKIEIVTKFETYIC